MGRGGGAFKAPPPPARTGNASGTGCGLFDGGPTPARPGNARGAWLPARPGTGGRTRVAAYRRHAPKIVIGVPESGARLAAGTGAKRQASPRQTGLAGQGEARPFLRGKT